jgi:hypothetical protein
MEEVWRDIATSPNYEVSTFGNVRHKTRLHILKPQPQKRDKKNYQVCIADTNGIQHNQKIQRLVAFAFIPNPNNKPQIDHIDRNPANNRVDNLRWVTRSEKYKNTGIRSDNTSGEKNITIRGHAFRLIIQKKTIQVSQTYPTLAEALVAREAFLQQR